MSASRPHNFRQRVFKPAAERAGVAWATPHKLRHGLASPMSEQGFSAAAIAAQLGHADNGVTALRWYVHSEAPRALDFIDSKLA
jgi:integrase